MIPLWTEGICGDGAAILCDGIMVPIEKVIESLNHCEALNTPDPQKWKCGALPGMSGAGGNTPTECNWPLCSCDPYADKVIAALQECGVMGNDTPDPRDAEIEPRAEDPHYLTTGMRGAADEDEGHGHHLQASYLRRGANEIDRLRASKVVSDHDIVSVLRDFVEMPLEGGYCDPLIEVMNSVADRAANEIERLREVVLPLATLFHDIWNAGYDSPTHAYDHMKSVGLLEAMRVWPDGGYKITDMGRSAIEIVNAARQTLDRESTKP